MIDAGVRKGFYSGVSLTGASKLADSIKRYRPSSNAVDSSVWSVLYSDIRACAIAY